MCQTTYIFISCKHPISRVHEHGKVVNRPPRSRWDDPVCPCSQEYKEYTTKLPCPFCLSEALLVVQTERLNRERAAAAAARGGDGEGREIEGGEETGDGEDEVEGLVKGLVKVEGEEGEESVV
ncbi:hypothetical protein ABW19_dt0209442 [Dactylella cylindrospora]|nr:hypothetical protein ABW19_dt0209442 [Dactylella cylindrospora]